MEIEIGQVRMTVRGGTGQLLCLRGRLLHLAIGLLLLALLLVAPPQMRHDDLLYVVVYE